MTIDSIAQTLIKIVQALLSPASFKTGDFGIEGPAVMVVPVAIGLLILSIWSFVWLYRDAKKRKKNGLVAVIFILITGWPLSFIWWFWLRPSVSTTIKT